MDAAIMLSLFLFSFCSVGVCFAAISKPHGTVSPCVQRSVKCLAMTSRRMVSGPPMTGHGHWRLLLWTCALMDESFLESGWVERVIYLV